MTIRRDSIRRMLRARYLLPLAGVVLVVAFLRPRGLQTPTFHVPAAGELSTSPAARRLRAGAADANLIIILLDAARADHFTSFGYKRNTTPNIARHLDKSILFTEAYATSSNTKASVGSLFTSQFPDTHGALSVPWSLPAEGATLAECMRDAGYTTAAFSANPLLSKTFGFDRGFEFFDEVFRHADLRPLDRGEVDGQLVLEAALDWLRAHKDKRFFAYIHFLEPHFPYTAPRRFQQRIDASTGDRRRHRRDDSFLYDATLAYADSVVGQLLEEMKALGLLDRSVVVFAADHGEAFGEHGAYRHSSTAYREMIHVPLAFRFPPDCSAQPRRVSGIFCLTDVMPTLLDLFRVDPPATMQGRSRLGLLAGEGEDTPAFAVSRARGMDPTGGVNKPREVSYALRVPRYSLVLGDRGRRVELYDRDADPGEQRNIASQRRDVVRKLRSQFEAWAATQRARPPVLWGGKVFATKSQQVEVDERTRRKLRSLGYIN